MAENGSSEKKTGCLLIHGFTGTPWAFNELKIKLLENGFDVSAPLLPGHGSSVEILAETKWPEWIECAAEELIKLKQSCTRVIVIGLSIGGAAALLLCSRYQIDGVVTISAPVRFDEPKLFLIPFLRLFKHNWKKSTSRSGQKLPKEAGYDSYPLAGLQQCLKLLRALRKNLYMVQCPALILHSRGDRRILAKNSSLIFNGISSKIKQIILYPHACHTITKGNNARQVENDIIEFIKGLSAGRDISGT